MVIDVKKWRHSGRRHGACLLSLAAGVLGPALHAAAATGSWTSTTSGDWGTSGNWSGGVIADGATFTASLGNDITTTVTTNLDTDRTIGHVNLSDNGGNNQARVISGTTTLTMDNGGGTPTINAVTFSTVGVILAGSNGLTFSTTGNGLSLTKTNTYTGVTTITGGAITYTSLPTPAGGLWINADVLSGTDGPLGNSASAVILSGTNPELVFDNTSTGANVFNRPITINTGTGVAALGKIATTGTTTFNGDISLGRTLVMYNRSSSALTFNGVLSGSGGLIVYATNASQTSDPHNSLNSFTGSTLISRGTLLVSDNVPMGGLGVTSPLGNATSAVVIGDGNSGGTFLALKVNGSYTISRPIHNTSFSSVANALSTIGGASPVFAGAFQNDKVIHMDIPTTSTITLSGDITGAGNIRRGFSATSGTLVLSGNNSAFTGSVDFLQQSGAAATGTLVVASNTALGTAATGTTVNSGSTLGFQGNLNYTTAEPVTVGGTGVGGGGAIRNISGNNTFAGPITLSAATTVTTNAGSLTLTSPVSGAFLLTKAGTGSLLLNNTVAGGVTVSAGTLGGSGIISGAVSVASGGTLAPGNSPGIITTGDLTFVSGANFTVELNGFNAGTGYDQASVVGSVNLGGANLNRTLGFDPLGLDARLFIVANDGSDPITGTFAGLLNNATFNMTAPGGTIVPFQISYFGDSGTNALTGGNDVVLFAIPEPASFALLTLGGLMMMTRRRARVS